MFQYYVQSRTPDVLVWVRRVEKCADGEGRRLHAVQELQSSFRLIHIWAALLLSQAADRTLWLGVQYSSVR